MRMIVLTTNLDFRMLSPLSGSLRRVIIISIQRFKPLTAGELETRLLEVERRLLAQQEELMATQAEELRQVVADLRGALSRLDQRFEADEAGDNVSAELEELRNLVGEVDSLVQQPIVDEQPPTEGTPEEPAPGPEVEPSTPEAPAEPAEGEQSGGGALP